MFDGFDPELFLITRARRGHAGYIERFVLDTGADEHQRRVHAPRRNGGYSNNSWQ